MRLEGCPSMRRRPPERVGGVEGLLVIFSPLDATLCTWPWAGAKAAGDKVSSPPRSPSSTQDEQPHSPGAGWGLHPHWRRPHPAQGV